MKKYFFSVLFLTLLFVLPAAAQTAQEENDRAAVSKAVEDYLSKKDVKAVKRALSEDAEIISVDGRGRVIKSLISKSAKVLPKNAAVTVPEQKITNIDLTPGGASVKVESEFPGNTDVKVFPPKYIQYISLLKLNGDWKIVSILMPPQGFIEAANK